MLAIVAAVLLLSGPTGSKSVPCDGNGAGDWLLVYRWTYVDDDGVRQVQEMFDGRRYVTEEHAYCGAEYLRLTGVRLPTLARYGRDSNVVPESITPMPHLSAVAMGIRGR